MEAFEKLNDPQTIFDSYYIGATYATEYPNVEELKLKNPNLYGEWQKICLNKYGIDEKFHNENEYYNAINNEYQNKGVFYNEFVKITSIVVARIDMKDKKLTRYFKVFNHDNEFELLNEFRNYMLSISSDALRSRPVKFPTLIGYNIINVDIPIIIKRIWKYRNRFEDESKPLPAIFKKYLNSKPWDSNVIDYNNIWKFNGMGSNMLSLITAYSDLKSIEEIAEMNDLSKTYWDYNNDHESNKKYIVNQLRNKVNLIMQLTAEMRKF